MIHSYVPTLYEFQVDYIYFACHLDMYFPFVFSYVLSKL